jgi:hypothetical protein
MGRVLIHSAIRTTENAAKKLPKQPDRLLLHLADVNFCRT